MPNEYFLIGEDVHESPSPSMMGAAFSSLGLDSKYSALSLGAEELPRTLARFAEQGVSGFNVTMPYKTAIPTMLDSLDATSSSIRAVNTVSRVEGKFVGFNTDVDGILRPLAKRGAGSIKRASVIGAGGAARAFFSAMHSLGCRSVAVMSRHPGTEDAFISSMRSAFPDVDVEVRPVDASGLRGADILFNASPAGSGGRGFPSALLGSLGDIPLVFDAVYSPLETDLTRAASRSGCTVVRGYEMLLHQGASAVEIWTGRTPTTELMESALLGRLRVRAN